MEWTVVTALVVLAGLTATILKPLLSINTQLTELNATSRHQTKQLTELTKINTQEHQSLQDTLHQHHDRLNDHEFRLNVVETQR